MFNALISLVVATWHRLRPREPRLALLVIQRRRHPGEYR